MQIVLRIIVLSIVMGAYFIWAFRGIENHPVESVPALLGLLAGFLAPTAIGMGLYAATTGRGRQDLPALAFRAWLVTAGVVAIGWLVFYAQDPAAAGFFRDNVLVGGLVLAALMVALNFGLLRALDYLAPGKT